MIIAIIIMLCIGATCGTILSIASKIFYVYEDPRISKVEYFMSGANCGGCGFAGCNAAAIAIVNGNAMPNICIASDNDSINKIAEIMGMDPGTAEIKKSYNSCKGGNRAEKKFYYSGIDSCLAASFLNGGNISCEIGCLGFGDCIKSCKFNAIFMSPDNYPIISNTKCVGCGACKVACPKDIIKIESISEKILSFNSYRDALSPCQQTCPAEIDIPSYIEKIKIGDYAGAINIIKEKNPLPLSCGRVCPHPCETFCRRGIEDESVSINQLKRFVADYEMKNKKTNKVYCAPLNNKKVAIIGGGPAGLSAAYFLRRLGYEPTILEAMPKLGGIIRYGIPEYRLPKKVLDWEINSILQLGINHICNTRLGIDFTIKELIKENFDSILITVGAWTDYNLNIEGESLDGCWQGINFLSKIASGEKINIGKEVAVIGGGNSAIDCARTLVRLGAKKVTIIYRRTKNEMPANKVEIQAAEHENINFKFLASPLKIISDKEGQVTHLEYLKMELGEPDSSGRRRPVPIENSETQIKVNTLITAIGQRPDMTFQKNTNDILQDLKLTRWNTIENNPRTLQSNIPYIFTAGDCATGPSLVVNAIGGARKAADSIHKYLSNKDIYDEKRLIEGKHIKGTIFDKVKGIKKIKRATMPEIEVSDRINSMIEVDLVLSEKDAINEANRCMECCRLCYNKDK